MLTQEFKDRIEAHSDIARKYLEIMYENWSSTRKRTCFGLLETAVKFIALLDDFVDYYMNKEDSDETIFPVFYMPTSEPWVKEIANEFLLLKMALTYNPTCYKFLNEQLRKKEQKTRLTASENKLRNLLKKGKALQTEETENRRRQFRKNIFVGNWKNYNPFNSSLTGNLDNATFNEITRSNLFGCNFNTDFTTIADKFLETGFDLQIENMFLFIGESLRYEIQNLNKGTINELRDRNFRVKNVFILRFSERPYQARKIDEWKKAVCKMFLQVTTDQIKREQNFTSFSKEELDYIFGRPYEQQHNFIEDPLFDYESLDEYLSDSEHFLSERNDLSLCFNRVLYENFCQKYSRPYNESIFNNLSSFWEKSMFRQIIDFIGDENQVGIVTNNVLFLNELQSAVQSAIHHPIYFTRYNIKDLKRYKLPMVGSTIYTNHADVNKVLVFQYWSHDLGKLWVTYPNSFDAYYTNFAVTGKQSICEFINGNILTDVYNTDLYRYNKGLDRILNSDYRRNIIKDMGGNYERPELFIDDYDMSPNDYENTTRSLKICYNTYGNETALPSDFYLYKYESELYIDRIDVIKEISGISEIQPLSSFSDSISKLIDDRSSSLSDLEREARSRLSGLTDEEKSSTAEAWKILLKKFTTDCMNVKDVYREMKQDMPDMVGFGRFLEWINPNSDFILPRKRRHQAYIFDLLKLPRVYLRIVRRRSMAAKRTTRTFNIEMDNFLKKILLHDINEYIYSELSENNIFDSLNIDTIDDLRSIKEMLSDLINLKTVRSIEYA